MEPTVLALENRFQGQVEFIIADVDDPQGKQLAGKFGVGLIPAIFIIDAQGKIIFQDTGLVPEDTLAQKLKAALDK